MFVRVKCEYCGKKFDKVAAEVKRSEALGRKHFCCRSHSTAYGNKVCVRHTRPNFKGRTRRDDLTPFRWFMARATVRSGRGNLPDTDLTPEYLKELWETQQGICPVTGWEMLLPQSTRGWEDRTPDMHRASLDRIDSSKGYVKGNVRYVCITVNLAKNNYLTDDDLREFAMAIISCRV